MITQEMARELISKHKQRIEDNIVKFPLKGERISVQLESADKALFFLLDVNNVSSVSSKLSYQTRIDEHIILIRVDINGSHRNPLKKIVPIPLFEAYNGTTIHGTHVHIYSEKYNDKWAVPIKALIGIELDDQIDILQHFYKICTIIRPPIFEYGLPL